MRPPYEAIDPRTVTTNHEAKGKAQSKAVVTDRGAFVASLRRGFKFVAEPAGLADVTPHVLRHTACTWMKQAGMATAEIAGFAAISKAMVERVYGHNLPDYMQNALRDLSGIM